MHVCSDALPHVLPVNPLHRILRLHGSRWLQDLDWTTLTQGNLVLGIVSRVCGPDSVHRAFFPNSRDKKCGVTDMAGSGRADEPDASSEYNKLSKRCSPDRDTRILLVRLI